MIDIDLSKFEYAKQVLHNQGIKTPLVTFESHPILIKAECLQPSGSFKIRGATYCLSLLTPEQQAAGVITYSTGNHAQAVALAAKILGIQATIVMSPEAPHFKIEATRKYGAIVIMTEPSSQARRKLAEELAQSEGYFLVPPYDHADVITGQGTIGLEILDEVDPEVVFVPLGGGGLIAGIAMAIKKINPSVKVIGVEPELEDDFYRSYKSGTKISMEGPSNSVADAIKIQTPGDITFPLVCNYVDDIIRVSEKQIIEATLMHLEKIHLMVEPSGALALAAALKYTQKSKPIVCVSSGGNTTLSQLAYFNSL